MSVPVLTFFNNKGGVGKTSLVFHLAWMFAEMGKRVVAIDLDPQANLTSAFLPEETLEELWDPQEPPKVEPPSSAASSRSPRWVTYSSRSPRPFILGCIWFLETSPWLALKISYRARGRRPWIRIRTTCTDRSAC